MGSAIASPSTTPVAFVGRPRGAASVQICSTLPQSAGGAPNFTGFARRRDPLLRPVAPACARLCRPVPSRTILHRPAPSHPAPFAAQPRRTPVPSHPSAIAPRAPSHSSPFALQRHRTPAPSHSCTVTPRPFASLLQSLPLLFPTTSPSKAHSHTALQSSRKSLEIDHRPISPNQMLLFFELLEFRANSHHSTP